MVLRHAGPSAPSHERLPPSEPAFAQPAFQWAFPLPFRILSLLTLSLLSWAITLHTLCRHCNINPSQLLHPSASTTNHYAGTTPLHPPVYHASASLAILILLGMALHQFITQLHLLQPNHSQLLCSLPAFTLLLVPLRLAAPLSHHFRLAHRRLHATLRRILLIPLPPQSLTPFSHVILTDFLTSLARPLGHLALFLSGLIHLHSELQLPLSVAVNCLPYLLRLKQCINDAILGPGKMKSMVNGVKYATAIPAIILSSKVRSFSTETSDSSMQVAERNSKIKLWIVASLINSIYSSWWDIVNDWGIGWNQFTAWFSQLKSQLKPELIPICRHHHNPTTPKQGRILFHEDTWWAYFIIIIVNLCLRMTWVVSVYVGPNQVAVELEYTMQALEVIRRWIWCLVRLEWAEMNRRREDVEGYREPRDTNLDHMQPDHGILGEGDAEEKFSDGPILHFDHNPHASKTRQPSNELLLKPSTSSSTTPIQNYQLEFTYDLR